MNEADKKRKDQAKIVPLKVAFKELVDFKIKVTSDETTLSEKDKRDRKLNVTVEAHKIKENNIFPESTYEPRTIDGHVVFVERKK